MKIIDLKELDNIISENEDERINFEYGYSYYTKFFEGFSDTHVWTFNSDVSLLSKMEASSKSPLKINQIAWGDFYESVHAAENLFYRRAHTLFISSYEQLIKRDFLSACILARSLLEVCMWNIYHSVIFEKNTKSIKKDPNKILYAQTELEEMVLKLIWGTNEKNRSEDIKQHKVFKIFEAVSKALKQREGDDFKLEDSYDLLSEFVHPNVEGNNLFLNYDINSQKKPISEVEYLVQFEQSSEKQRQPVTLLLTTLTWCMRAIIFSSEKYSNTRQNIKKKFKLNQKKTSTIH